MKIKGKLSKDFICDTCMQEQEDGKEATIELSPEELAKQIKDEEQLRYITARFYLHALDKMHLPQPQQFCKCPESYSARTRFVKDGICGQCHNPIPPHPEEKEIKLPEGYYVNPDDRSFDAKKQIIDIMNKIDKILQYIRHLNKKAGEK